MTKNIIKIALCAVSVAGFILIGFESAGSVSPLSVYKALAADGLPAASTYLYSENKAETSPPPYTYVNLPRAPDPPLAASLYDEESSRAAEKEKDDPDGQFGNGPFSLPAGVYQVIGVDMSEGQTEDNLLYRNESVYSPDLNSLSKSEFPLKYAKTVQTGTDEPPLVLIIHTHGTECYLKDGEDTYTDDTPTRSEDTEQNVVAVGEAMAEELTANGIKTIHCRTMFDAESYSKSYDLSESAVLEYLAAYPSIQYVFDVHRDSVVRENKEKIKTYTEIDGVPTAQAMFVVGTDSAGAYHPTWMENLTVASVFQRAVVGKYEHLMRPLSLRAASFNAEHAPGSILIEIGTCGNTVSEAKNCARLIADVISDVILHDGIAECS